MLPPDTLGEKRGNLEAGHFWIIPGILASFIFKRETKLALQLPLCTLSLQEPSQ